MRIISIMALSYLLASVMLEIVMGIPMISFLIGMVVLVFADLLSWMELVQIYSMQMIFHTLVVPHNFLLTMNFVSGYGLAFSLLAFPMWLLVIFLYAGSMATVLRICARVKPNKTLQRIRHY